MYDYSKLDWHDGAPDVQLADGMIFDVEEFKDGKFWVTGKPGNEAFDVVYYFHATILRWAWLPGFEEGNSELHPRSTEFSRRGDAD
jgi:hypothetical protein